MTHLSDIWDCMQSKLPKDKWLTLREIHSVMENNLQLDNEDFLPQSPGSDVPKWKRNVRNVLQQQKKKGTIEWDKSRASYRIYVR